ncbi:zinc-dependent alcohol dehydrogenase family protein [Minwuia sp.]|uniref:zinc-dependent alcohol dehydrogenase family protein n=1 Tax=Minwuia sp. TaxID=2493630 RepID=UPI003A8FAB09
MKQMQFTRFGDPADVAEIIEVDAPGDPGPGRVNVRVLASPINPADLLNMEGRYGAELPPLPATQGAEGVGRIIAVGDGVDNVKVGDLVTPPARGLWREIVQGPAAGLVALPADADILQLSMLRANPASAWLMLRDYVTLESGDYVIQNAANSAVGRHIIRLAKSQGWKTVNVVRRPDLIDELTGLGADHVFVDGEDLPDRVVEATGGNLPRLAIDAVGGTSVQRLARATADGGTVVNYGLLSGDPLMIDARETVFRDLTIRGFWLAPWFAKTDPREIGTTYAFLGKKMAEGLLHVPVEATYPLERVKEAVAHAGRDGRNGKVIITMDDV